MTKLPEKTHERLYKPSTKQVELVEVPKVNFLMVDGEGDPNTAQEYKDALEALYPLAYKLKFALKKAHGLEYKVGPLEGLWWADNMAEFSVERKGDWKWTMMIAQPEAVTSEWVASAKAELGRKKNPVALHKVRLEGFHEGRAAQIMHIGPYSTEGPNIAKVHAFIYQQGYSLDELQQKHHEIYLGDPRRTAPEKLKTILRQPF